MEHGTCNIIKKVREAFHFLFQVLYYMLHEKEFAEIHPQIYSQRKSSDSPGGFGPGRAREAN